MKEILEELNSKVAALGSLVVTRDGLVIASHCRADLNDERFAALAQKILGESAELLDRLGLSGCDRFSLTADCGRLMFVELSCAFLVVITALNADAEQIRLEIESTARRIERATRIAV